MKTGRARIFGRVKNAAATTGRVLFGLGQVLLAAARTRVARAWRARQAARRGRPPSSPAVEPPFPFDLPHPPHFPPHHPAHLPSQAGRAGRPGRSIRRRILEAFLLLALATGGVFAGLAYFSYEAAVDRLVRWHMEPVMRLLVAADEGKIKGSKGTVVSGEELAKTLRLKLRTGDRIGRHLRPVETDEEELVRLDRDRYVLSYRSEAGKDYAVEGKIKDFDELEEALAWVFAGCLGASLLLAGLLGLILGRGVVAPLLALARVVREGRPLETSPLCRRADETGFLARSFARREKSLRAYLAREQLFTGDVSHELRTPLTVLQGSVEVLESVLESRAASGEAALPASVLRPQLERMQRTLRGMTATVQTMLLLARAPEQVRNAAVDLSELARREADKTETRLAGRPVAFRADIAPDVTAAGQAELAALILNNLLDNACRYTEQGEVTLLLGPDRLAVTDTAAPIPEDVRARMFERGTRGQTTTPGSGLGLSLVQRACEHMGWSVGYEALPPVPGAQGTGGNRFTVRFKSVSTSNMAKRSGGGGR